jgi:sugar phosphate isomerase/epimerase
MFSSFNARAVGLSLSAAETIEVAASAGFAGVDLLVRDLLADDESPAALRRRMDDLGLVGGAFPMPVSWKGDEATFRRDLAGLPRLLDAASVLGLMRTATWVLPEIPDRFAGPSEANARASTVALHLERLGPIAEALGRYGMRLGLETIGVERFRSGRTPPFITRLGGLGPILHPLASEHPGVGLLLDTLHLYASGEDLQDAIGGRVESIVWVHVADLPAGASGERAVIEDHERGLPGEHGAIDNHGILRALGEGGYDGPVTAEPLARCHSLAGLDARTTADVVVRAVRSVWPT